MTTEPTFQPLRITVIALNYAPEPSGTAPYTSRLAELLVQEGFHVQVLAGYPHYPDWKLADGYTGWSRTETINGVHVSRLRHYIPGRVSYLQRLHLELSFGLRVLVAQWHRPDVVLVVSPPLFSAVFAVLRSRLSRSQLPTGVWVQDIYSRGLEETGGGYSRLSSLMKRIEGFVLRSATKVTVIHDRFGDYAVSLGVPKERVGTIRNWSNIAPSSAQNRTATRQALGWSNDDVVVLHAGNMGVKQGLENLVNAARLADSTNSRVRFVLLGNGNQREVIETKSSGVSAMSFIASLPDSQYQATLEAADILVVNELAGLREMSVPSKLTSYFATGLPVIAATDSKSTTADEIRRSGGGVRVDAGAPSDLLFEAERLASDSALSRRLGAAGRKYAETNLSQHAAILQYGAWLRELAASSGKRPRYVKAP